MPSFGSYFSVCIISAYIAFNIIFIIYFSDLKLKRIRAQTTEPRLMKNE